MELTQLLYIDPAATSVLISSLTAIVVAVGASAIVIWRKFKKKIDTTLNKDPNANKEVEGDLVINDDTVEEVKTVEETKTDDSAPAEETPAPSAEEAPAEETVAKKPKKSK